MDLLDYLYQQKSYGEVLHSLGIPLDDLKIIPFTDGQSLISDLTGNAKGFITDNVNGGVTITDPNMNMIGSTQPMNHSTVIQDQHFQQTGMLHDNVHGGANLYEPTGQMEMMSTENIFFGRDYYDANMHVLGSSNETINDVTAYSMNESPVGDLGVSLDIDQFSDYFSSLSDFAVEGFETLGADIWAVDAGELFDFFDLF